MSGCIRAFIILGNNVTLDYFMCKSYFYLCNIYSLSIISWILVQLRKVFYPDLLLSHHDEIMWSWCGKKDKLKGQTQSQRLRGTSVSSCASRGSGCSPCVMFPCQPASEATSEISCYLGNRWQAKGYAAGRVNHEASSYTFNSAFILRPLKASRHP